jgi:hypothetical protein
MPIRDICLNALNISLVLENSKNLALETGGWDTHDIVASPRPVLQPY